MVRWQCRNLQLNDECWLIIGKVGRLGLAPSFSNIIYEDGSAAYWLTMQLRGSFRAPEIPLLCTWFTYGVEVWSNGELRRYVKWMPLSFLVFAFVLGVLPPCHWTRELVSFGLTCCVSQCTKKKSMSIWLKKCRLYAAWSLGTHCGCRVS